jgi:hypothetical protein
MLNFKEQELSNNLFNKLKKQFPAIELVEIIENSYDGGDVWMRVIPPLDRQERTQFSELAAELTTEILMEYGYDIVITYAANPAVSH